jgi:DNA integrity scanning protein DisA with diadenylate cyclase activity
MFEMIASKLHTRSPDVCRRVIELAVEIAREGREGRRIGTLFTVGDADRVLAHSRPLILDPIAPHPEELRTIWSENLRGTLKELAQLDGAFVFDDNGVIVAACRYLDAKASDIELPMGFGSRHLAAASISKVTGATAVVVSESAIVRIFDGGVLIGDIIPELWLLNREQVFSNRDIRQDEPAPGTSSKSVGSIERLSD